MNNKKRFVLILVLVITTYILGDFETVRTDGQGGWCADFGQVMVCNRLAATDYVLGD